MSSPWIYVVLFALAAIDGFFPLVPSESSVITAGVFAATGEPSLPLVILAAALGAFAGDQASYGLGRLSGPRLHRRARPGSKRRAALDGARGALAARGGVIIVVSRYFPGARTAVTLTAGAVGYRWRRFACFGAVAAISWGVYSALLGHLGGVAFESDPLKGLLLGLGLAAVVALAAELGRRLYRRRVASARPGNAGLAVATAQRGTPATSRPPARTSCAWWSVARPPRRRTGPWSKPSHRGRRSPSSMWRMTMRVGGGHERVLDVQAVEQRLVEARDAPAEELVEDRDGHAAAEHLHDPALGLALRLREADVADEPPDQHAVRGTQGSGRWRRSASSHGRRAASARLTPSE